MRVIMNYEFDYYCHTHCMCGRRAKGVGRILKYATAV